MKHRKLLAIVLLAIMACLLSAFKLGGDIKIVTPAVTQQADAPDEGEAQVYPTPTLNYSCYGKAVMGVDDLYGCEDWEQEPGPYSTALPYAYP